MTTLFDPIQLGAIDAKNRILMSPLTRGRGTREHVPTPIMAEYYAQRASAGLIISEATGISREGLGWPYAPGIWSAEQVEAWKPITKAVHDKGGKIVVQLWHMGRMVHPSVTGQQPVSSSPTSAPGQIHTYDGKQDPEQARALTKDDITRILGEYEVAARNAIEAGFDGVQIHAANGYLIDEFLRDGTNHREDEYGGSPENRIRLLREVTERVIATIGAERVSVRLSPNGDTQAASTVPRRRSSCPPPNCSAILASAFSNCASLARTALSARQTSRSCMGRFVKYSGALWSLIRTIHVKRRSKPSLMAQLTPSLSVVNSLRTLIFQSV